jgi:hypothetical protein
MGKGSRLGAGPCGKQAEDEPQAPEPRPPEGVSSPPGTSRADTWSPLIRSSLVADRAPGASRREPGRELRSAWGEEPLHPRKISSRRLRLTQIATERREQKKG